MDPSPTVSLSPGDQNRLNNGKRRKINVNKWKDKKRKGSRNAGQPYISKTKKPVPGKLPPRVDEACPSPEVVVSSNNDLQKDWGTKEKHYVEQPNLVKKQPERSDTFQLLETKNLDTDCKVSANVLSRPCSEKPSEHSTTQDADKPNNRFRNSIYSNKIIQNNSGTILALVCSMIVIASYLRMTS